MPSLPHQLVLRQAAFHALRNRLHGREDDMEARLEREAIQSEGNP